MIDPTSALLLVDPHGVVRAVHDDQRAPLLGPASHTLVGRRADDLFEPDPLGLSFGQEHEVRRRAEARAPDVLRALVLPLSGADSVRTGLLVRLEAATREESRPRDLLMRLPVMLAAFDEESRLVAWNAESERIAGHAADDLAGRADALDLLCPDPLSRHRALAALQGGSDGEWTLTAKDGTTRDVRWSDLSERLPVPGWTRWGIGVDLTGSPRAAHARSAQADLLSTILSELPVVLWRVDADGIFVESRGAGLSRLGLVEHEALGRNAFEDYPAAREQIRRAISGESLNTVLSGDGPRGPWSYHTFVAPDHSTGGMIGFSIDVTERIRLERSLLQTRKMEALGMLAGGIAHDFNNLMQVVTGYSSLLLEQGGLDNASHATLGQILRAADRATGLTRQLLAFSRRQALEPRALDINLVLTDLREMVRLLVGESVAVRLDLAPAGAWVRVDPTQIEQVVVNLAANARDAMPEGGRLRIRTRCVDRPPVDGAPRRVVLLDVRDTGVGMAPEVVERAFEPFYTTRRDAGGTGLGLATVYGIVHQSAGTIELRSHSGRGTRVRIELPAIEPEDSAAPATPPADAPGGSERVLVVEDDAQVRDLVRAGLERAGYRVVTADNGRAALDLLAREAPFDLVLSDVVMPEVGGFELEAAVRHLPHPPEVLLMSGYVHGSEATENGARPVLSKPFALSELLRRVRALLDARASR